MKQDKNQKNFFENLFLHSKPVKMLITLNVGPAKFATQVSKAVDCTYSHTVKVLDQFKNLGLVEFDKKGRIKIVNLTEQGSEIAHDFEGLRKKFNRIMKNVKLPEPTKITKTKKK